MGHYHFLNTSDMSYLTGLCGASPFYLDYILCFSVILCINRGIDFPFYASQHQADLRGRSTETGMTKEYQPIARLALSLWSGDVSQCHGTELCESAALSFISPSVLLLVSIPREARPELRHWPVYTHAGGLQRILSTDGTNTSLSLLCSTRSHTSSAHILDIEMTSDSDITVLTKRR